MGSVRRFARAAEFWVLLVLSVGTAAYFLGGQLGISSVFR